MAILILISYLLAIVLGVGFTITALKTKNKDAIDTIWLIWLMVVLTGWITGWAFLGVFILSYVNGEFHKK